MTDGSNSKHVWHACADLMRKTWFSFFLFAVLLAAFVILLVSVIRTGYAEVFGVTLGAEPESERDTVVIQPSDPDENYQKLLDQYAELSMDYNELLSLYISRDRGLDPDGIIGAKTVAQICQAME